MKEIPLTQGQVALVDDEDYEWLNKYKWCARWNKGTGSFYALRKNKGKSESMHRDIMKPSKGLVVDHINHNTLDNRKSELRIVTHQQNIMNKSVHKNNSSGFAGVKWHKKNKSWISTIRFNYKDIYLGSFKLKCQAIKTRRNAEEKYFGEYAYKGDHHE